jgi:hypothetical protein
VIGGIVGRLAAELEMAADSMPAVLRLIDFMSDLT